MPSSAAPRTASTLARPAAMPTRWRPHRWHCCRPRPRRERRAARASAGFGGAWACLGGRKGVLGEILSGRHRKRTHKKRGAPRFRRSSQHSVPLWPSGRRTRPLLKPSPCPLCPVPCSSVRPVPPAHLVQALPLVLGEARQALRADLVQDAVHVVEQVALGAGAAAGAGGRGGALRGLGRGGLLLP